MAGHRHPCKLHRNAVPETPSDDAVPRRTDIALAREPFPNIQAQIAELMMPPGRAVATDQRFRQQWQAARWI